MPRGTRQCSVFSAYSAIRELLLVDTDWQLRAGLTAVMRVTRGLGARKSSD